MGAKKKIKFCLILGTRPEIIKMSPVIRELKKKRLKFFIVHTNQHYDENLDKIFFRELNLTLPKYNLGIGSGTHGDVTGRMLIGLEKLLLKEKPGMVLVQGDTNTVLAGAIAASKLGIKIGHIEAGLRSRDETMPEETNRILTDHMSAFLFAPTAESKKNLLQENIRPEKIFVTGNTIVDAVRQNLKISKKNSQILNDFRLNPQGYFLVTAHRQENVDDPKKLANILASLERIGLNFNLPVIFPVHPRTKKRIGQFNIRSRGINFIEPVGYLEFLRLLSDCRLVLTDSGGIQEEACLLGKPCVTLRENTERPETVKAGANILAGTNPLSILRKTGKMLSRKKKWSNPLGEAGVGRKIMKIIIKNV